MFPYVKNVEKDLRGFGQRSVERWSVDPTDADIVMSPEYDAVDVDCNVEA